MAAEKTCCVPNCGKTRADNLILHSFPNPDKYPENFVKWITAIGGDILNMDRKYVFKYRRVCHLHFEQKFWMAGKRLSAIALPTLQVYGSSYNTRDPLAENLQPQTRDPLAENQQPHTHDLLPEYLQPHTHNPLADITNVCRTSYLQPSTSTGVSGPSKTRFSNKIYSGVQTAIPADINVRSLKKIINGLEKKSDSYAMRLKKAMCLSQNKTFQRCMTKFTSLAALFTRMQFREVGKNKMGRRFTTEEKVLALSLYKQGPKAYRWLKKVFILPSPITLRRLLSKASINVGVNKNIFEQLRKRGGKMKTQHKLCTLLFDEVAISPHFDYNRKKDKISGFVNNGSNTKKQIADHALVFMIRGVFKNYKQPIAYTFCAGSTPKEDLKNLIVTMITEVEKCGFIVVATVCDQGTGNVSAINQLIEENRQAHLRLNKEFKHRTMMINKKEVIPLFDAPHLIKGIRNNLLTKNLYYKIDEQLQTAKWDHIIQLHEENPEYKGIRLIKNLTEAHVNPKKISKMKVKYATQVFSKTVATNMGYLSEKGILPPECKETADILMFFDELFDSMNGSFINSKKRCGKDLLAPVTPKSNHKRIWHNAKKVLGTMKFITKEGKITSVPTISNWLHTIENMEYLVDKLKNEYDIKSLWTRHFNQDPLENFFGCIRSHGCRNISPTPAGFEAAFTSLLINNLTSNHSPGSNCEEDNCTVFKSMNYLLKNENKDENVREVDFEDLNVNYVNLDFKLRDPRICGELHYVAGYLLKAIRKNTFKNCKQCINVLYDKNQENEYLKRREFVTGKKWLIYPERKVINILSIMQDTCIFILEKKPEVTSIKQYVKTIMCVQTNFNFINCERHRSEISNNLLDLGSRFFICNWCRDANKILNGTRQDFSNNDSIKKMCNDYYCKRNKSSKPYCCFIHFHKLPTRLFIKISVSCGRSFFN